MRHEGTVPLPHERTAPLTDQYEPCHKIPNFRTRSPVIPEGKKYGGGSPCWLWSSTITAHHSGGGFDVSQPSFRYHSTHCPRKTENSTICVGYWWYYCFNGRYLNWFLFRSVDNVVSFRIMRGSSNETSQAWAQRGLINPIIFVYRTSVSDHSQRQLLLPRKRTVEKTNSWMFHDFLKTDCAIMESFLSDDSGYRDYWLNSLMKLMPFAILDSKRTFQDHQILTWRIGDNIRSDDEWTSAHTCVEALQFGHPISVSSDSWVRRQPPRTQRC
jgi:hypothetical protein